METIVMNAATVRGLMQTPERLLHSPKNTAIILDISERSVWRLIGSGKLDTVMVGNRRRITDESIRRVASEGAATDENEAA